DEGGKYPFPESDGASDFHRHPPVIRLKPDTTYTASGFGRTGGFPRWIVRLTKGVVNDETEENLRENVSFYRVGVFGRCGGCGVGGVRKSEAIRNSPASRKTAPIGTRMTPTPGSPL